MKNIGRLLIAVGLLLVAGSIPFKSDNGIRIYSWWTTS
jgi:hypothetical protein